jgi:alkylhydroperoxidase/carboxymuconolactone decarboxylase family protein YurZ
MSKKSVDERFELLEDELQGEFPAKIKVAATRAPEMFEGYTKMREVILKEGQLSRKSKLLIAVGLLTAQRADETLSLYCQMALNAEATKEELIEAMSVGVIFSGGPSIVTMSNVMQELNLSP